MNSVLIYFSYISKNWLFSYLGIQSFIVRFKKWIYFLAIDRDSGFLLHFSSFKEFDCNFSFFPTLWTINTLHTKGYILSHSSNATKFNFLFKNSTNFLCLELRLVLLVKKYLSLVLSFSNKWKTFDHILLIK